MKEISQTNTPNSTFNERVVSIEAHPALVPDEIDWSSVVSQKPLPHLRRLAIYHPRMVEEEPPLMTIDAPHLELHMYGNVLPLFPSSIQVLSKLHVTLTSGRHPLEQGALLDMLRCTPQLEKLTLKRSEIFKRDKMNSDDYPNCDQPKSKYTNPGLRVLYGRT